MRKLRIIAIALVVVLICPILVGCKKREQNEEPIPQLIDLAYYNINDGDLLYTAKTEDLRYIKYRNCITITECLSNKVDMIIPALIEDLPVVLIENGAFSGNNAIQRLIIGPNVVSIADNAFSNCKSLVSVQMSGSVCYIGNNAFSGCSSLRSIIIPAAIDNVASGAFSGCTSLKKVIIESRSSSDDKAVLAKTTERSIESSFSGCPQLAAIWIPADINRINSSILGGARHTVVFSEEATAAAVFAAHARMDFGITTRDEFDMAVRQYNPIEEETSYDQIGRTIQAGKFNVKLTAVDYFKQIGSQIANEGEQYVRIVFEITNAQRYEAYFDGLESECNAWSRDASGVMHTYIKRPVLIGESASGYGCPAFLLASGETKTCCIVLKVNTKSACVSIKFPEANDTFYVR